jgi:hypothetical protein
MTLRTDEVKAEIQSLLARFPELREDDEALVLSLESETDALALCERLVRKIKETEAHREGCAGYIRELKSRQDLLDLRADNIRNTLVSIMAAAGVKNLPLPIATLSLRYGQHVNIVEHELLPEQFRRHLPWEPHKNLIGAALRAGQFVPGATLSNPEPSLSIRVK